MLPSYVFLVHAANCCANEWWFSGDQVITGMCCVCSQSNMQCLSENIFGFPASPGTAGWLADWWFNGVFNTIQVIPRYWRSTS